MKSSSSPIFCECDDFSCTLEIPISVEEWQKLHDAGYAVVSVYCRSGPPTTPNDITEIKLKFKKDYVVYEYHK